MRLRKSEILALVIILVSLATAIYFYPRLSDKIPSHWNYKGEVDGYMAKSWGVFLMPVFLFVLFLVFFFIPKLDPLKANVDKFRKYFDGFIILICLFMLVIYFQTILWARGIEIKPNILFPIALGVLFYYIGIMLNHSRRNWFIGFRTPWTLSSDAVWDKTHKLGGKLFKLSGIIAVVGILFPNYAMIFVLGPAIILLICLTIYSYLEYKKETK